MRTYSPLSITVGDRLDRIIPAVAQTTRSSGDHTRSSVDILIQYMLLLAYETIFYYIHGSYRVRIQ